jgi:hypothetical protein
MGGLNLYGGCKVRQCNGLVGLVSAKYSFYLLYGKSFSKRVMG